MNREELETLQDEAADSLLRVRERIEQAVDTGELPVWVIDACAALERASLVYGAAAERIKLDVADLETETAAPPSGRLH